MIQINWGEFSEILFYIFLLLQWNKEQGYQLRVSVTVLQVKVGKYGIITLKVGEFIE